MQAGRKCHLLRRNHGTYTPEQNVVVHVETQEGLSGASTSSVRRRFRVGHAICFRPYAGKMGRWQELTFHTPAQFWTWLVQFHRKKRSVWLWAHHLGETLTYLDFWELVENGFYRLRERTEGKESLKDQKEPTPAGADYLLCTKDPPTIVLAKHGEHFLHAVDVRNYFNRDLDDLGELVSRRRQARPKNALDAQGFAALAENGAKILRDVVLKLETWWKENDCGVFRYTASSLAFAAYRHKHLTQEILCDDCEPARELSRDALATGEARLWFAGKIVDPLTYADRRARAPKHIPLKLRPGPVYVVDCNSCYPYVMRDNLFPRKLVAYKAAATMADLETWRGPLSLIARVRIQSPEQPYPVLLEKERWFCVGDFWTTLAGPELDAAYADGAIVDVSTIAAYLPGRLFKSFVDRFYPLKVAAGQAGQDAEYAFFKLILDALPGKFAQRNVGWEWTDDPGPGFLWGSYRKTSPGSTDSRLYRVIAGYVQQEGDKMDSLDSLPAISAFVNAYARVYMRAVRRQIGEQHILYQDTDSLHLTADGYDRLVSLGMVDRWELGKFRLETIAQVAEYRGPKDYTLDGRHVVAGRKLSAVPDGHNVYVQEQTAELDTVLGRRPDGSVLVDKVRKRLGKYHPRGRWLSDGRVMPALLKGSCLSLLPPGAEHASASHSHKRK